MVQAIFLLALLQANKKQTQEDIRLITNESELRKTDFDNLFGKLRISPADKENRRRNEENELVISA